jgi:hypothetical protein
MVDNLIDSDLDLIHLGLDGAGENLPVLDDCPQLVEDHV